MKNLSKFGPTNRPYPLNDFLFYKTMGEKGDEAQLVGFLNAVLGRKGKEHIETVEISENRTFAAEMMNGKSCILDVKAVLADGTKVDIEVQLRNEGNMERRSLYYWNKLYAEDFKEGEDYLELPNVVAINIVDYDFLPVKNFHTCFRLREDDDHSLILTPALEIHFVNMVKWRKWYDKNVLDDPLQRWLTWFDPKSPPELIAEVVNMDNAILAAKEKQDYVLTDKEAQQLYWRRQLAEMGERAARAYALKEGHAEGFAEGHAEGLAEGHAEGEKEKSIEIARKLKTRGLPLAEIAEITELPIETIERL